MGIGFDTHEVTAFADAITKASAPARKDVEAVVFKGAMNIKRDSARRIARHPHWRRVGAAIDFDTFFSLKGPAAEIGPNHGKPQGNLGHIPEYGSPTSAPTPYMRSAGRRGRAAVREGDGGPGREGAGAVSQAVEDHFAAFFALLEADATLNPYDGAVPTAPAGRYSVVYFYIETPSGLLAPDAVSLAGTSTVIDGRAYVHNVGLTQSSARIQSGPLAHRGAGRDAR
jgi:hypothetical protein